MISQDKEKFHIYCENLTVDELDAEQKFYEEMNDISFGENRRYYYAHLEMIMREKARRAEICNEKQTI